MILTYEYYNSHFPKLTEEEFNKYSYSAERYVLKRLPKTYEEYTELEKQDIQDCICNILNYQSIVKKSTGLASVSNDGYSESYLNREESVASSDLNAILHEWLGSLYQEYVAF